LNNFIETFCIPLKFAENVGRVVVFTISAIINDVLGVHFLSGHSVFSVTQYIAYYLISWAFGRWRLRTA